MKVARCIFVCIKITLFAESTQSCTPTINTSYQKFCIVKITCQVIIKYYDNKGKDILLQFLCLTNTSKNTWPFEQTWGPNHMGPYQSKDHVRNAKSSCSDLTTHIGLNQKITSIQSIYPNNSHLDRWLTVYGIASCRTERRNGGGSDVRVKLLWV